MSDSTENDKKKDKRGILRLDISKPRNSSGSVEFRNQPELISQASPSSQSTQLSVKWAFPQDTTSKENAYDDLGKIDKSPQPSDRRAKKSLSADYFLFQPYIDQFFMEPIDLPEYVNSEDEDYSLSLSAVIQKRASIKGRGKKGCISPRRGSSPMGHVSGAGNSIVVAKTDRRRSSVYTTSSGDTAISLGDGANQPESTKEQIFENIRLHKEVLQSVKAQPWSMRRKLRLVRQAREYIARHEGALQERFAMSRSTRDLWARFKIVVAVKWQYYHREITNFSTVFVPWQLRIKEIESHFGSVVASYFTFLRWLFWVNIVIAFTLSTFVVVPEFFASQHKDFDPRKKMTEDELANATRLTTILNFEGYWKYSPLFYGYYSDYSDISQNYYDLPLAYFLTGVAVYIYSFWATLRKMAENSRMSKLSSKDDEYVFSWKLFTGWDFMIGHAETAHNRIASVVLGFKEALLEEAEKKKDKQNWKVIVLRIIVNVFVTALLVVAAQGVVMVVNRSERIVEDDTYWKRNEMSFVITGITFFFPMGFEALGYFEHYHPRKQLRWQLGRIMLLNLLVLYTFIIALFKKIDNFAKREGHPHFATTTLSPNISTTPFDLDDPTAFTTEMDLASLSPDESVENAIVDTFRALIQGTAAVISETVPELTTMLSTNLTYCYQVAVNCSKPSSRFNRTMVTSLFFLNFTTTILPELWPHLNVTNDFTMSSSSASSAATMAYTDETFDWFDYNTTAEYDFNSSSSTTMTSTSIDFFNYSTTDAYDTTTIDGDSTTITDANLSDLDYDLETKTTKTVDEYEYEYDGESRRRRKKRNEEELVPIDYPDYNYDEDHADIEVDEDKEDKEEGDGVTGEGEDETMSTTIDYMNGNETFTTIIFDDYYTTTNESTDSTDNYNQTEFISSTIASFIDNFTTTEWPDEMNTTYVSELWTQYLTTLNSSLTDEYADEDENEPEKCYVMRCEVIERIEDEDETTPSTPSTTVTSTMATTKATTQMPVIQSTIPKAPTCPPMFSSAISDLLPTTMSSGNGTKQDNLTALHLDQRKYCWETMFGQELVKLTVLDLLFTIVSTLFMDFFRALFVRFMNKCWCWDLEKKFPKYGDFKIAENILHLVNNQGHVWMGMFFSPGLAILNLIKLGVLMYFRSWAVLTCNVPHEVVFRASRSNNFYLALLLTMLFLCVLPVSYAIVQMQPSRHCGPFTQHPQIYFVFTDTMHRLFPSLRKPLDTIASPSTIIPLLLLLVLIIYYLMALTGALREANDDLRNQLRRERQEERRKMQRVVNAKMSDENDGNNAMDRWRKVLEASSPLTPVPPGGQTAAEVEEEKMKARREFLARIMKKALRKSSNTSEDESHPGVDDDETDTEQHEQLPHDQEATSGRRRRDSTASKTADDRKPESGTGKPRKPSFTRMRDIVEIAKVQTTEGKGGVPVKVPPKKEKVRPSHEDPDESADRKDEIVAERRLLRRQQSTQESEGSISMPTSIQVGGDKDAINYEVINEKNNATEKKAKSKKKSATDPEVFKFDNELYDKSNEGASSDTDRTSYQDIVQIRPSKDIAENLTPSTKRRSRSPKIFTIGDGSDETKPQDDISIASSGKSKSPSPSVGPVEEKSPKSSDDILKQPMKRLNSFLALVREAVQAKKQDQADTTPTVSAVTQAPDMHSRVRKFIDDSNSISTTMSEEGSTTTKTDSLPSAIPSSRSGSSKRRRRFDPPVKPKRQDSQASIWSDNIPVITISKTASDECILEKEIEEKRTPPKAEADADLDVGEPESE